MEQRLRLVQGGQPKSEKRTSERRSLSVPGQINHLITQSSGHFRSPEFNNGEAFNQDNISERFVETRELAKVAPGKTQYAGLDLSASAATIRPQGRRRNMRCGFSSNPFVRRSRPCRRSRCGLRMRRSRSRPDQTAPVSGPAASACSFRL